MSSEETEQKLPEIDFSNFVLSLAATAMVQLGMVPNPETGDTAEPDFLIARHTIDTLDMLREKTRGNLDDEETKLLDSMLYELRMRAVETSGTDGGS
ncbi:MAG: DUF1844 domain-containing protein [Myxococcota bacterium]|nr:DUF1844 domain-containing protein [Myxococcota bacterium]